jgi:hypothetical protein
METLMDLIDAGQKALDDEFNAKLMKHAERVRQADLGWKGLERWVKKHLPLEAHDHVSINRPPDPLSHPYNCTRTIELIIPGLAPIFVEVRWAGGENQWSAPKFLAPRSFQVSKYDDPHYVHIQYEREYSELSVALAKARNLHTEYAEIGAQVERLNAYDRLEDGPF